MQQYAVWSILMQNSLRNKYKNSYLFIYSFFKFSIPKCYHKQLKYYTSFINTFYSYTNVYMSERHISI